MRVLIIEDEELGIERLQKQLKIIDPEIVIAGTATSVKQAVSWLKNNLHPDLILADIELSDGQCFNIFRHVPTYSKVVFVTSFDESAMKVFRFNQFEYLLKPVKKEDLQKIISEASNQPVQEPAAVNIEQLIGEFKKQEYHRNYRNRLLVKQGNSLMAVETEEIAYVYTDRNFSYVKTWDNETYAILHTLDELEEMLVPTRFSRVNPTFIVHARAIAHIHQLNGKARLSLKPQSDKEIMVDSEQAAGIVKWKKQAVANPKN